MKKQIYRKFSKSRSVGPERNTIVVPAFTLAIPIWAGASTLLAEFPYTNNFYFSIRTPVKKFGSNFIFAVRWTLDEVIYRFKFWDDSLSLLYYPLYSGQRIGLNAVFEVWSINSASAPTSSTAKTLETSALTFPDDCCGCDVTPYSVGLVQTPASPLPPYASCNPFCDTLC